MLQRIREDRDLGNLGQGNEGVLRYVGTRAGVLWRSSPPQGHPHPDARKRRMSGNPALLFVGSLRERLSIIRLTGDEYADALTAAATAGVGG